MRQKVGKDRSQGGGYPLGYPPPVLPAPENRDLRSQFIYLPTAFREISSSGAVPLGTRTGQPLPQAEDARCEASQLVQPKARPRSPYDGRRHPQAEGRYFSLRSSDLRWRQPRSCSAVAPAPLNDHWPRAWAEFSPWRPVASPPATGPQRSPRSLALPLAPAETPLIRNKPRS